MEHKSGKAREQLEIICLEEQVEPNSAARQIDIFVETMDTSYFERSEPKNTGRPPYSPKDLLKLYIRNG